ncbi:hypothetical protein D3C72_908410 [compost metagenome]
MRIAEERHLRVKHGVFQLHAPARVFDFLALDVGVSGDGFPTPGVADREVGALIVTEAVGRSRRLAFVGVTVLLGLACLEGDVVVLIRRKRQLGRTTVGVLFVEAVGKVVFVTIRRLPIELQANQVLDQRPGDEGAGAVVVAGVGAVLEGRFAAHAAIPVGGHFAGDDVDHPAHGVGAVQRRHWPTDHLDAFDRLKRRHPALLDPGTVTVRTGRPRVLALAVDQHQRVLGGHATDADIAGTGATGHHYTRNILQGIGHITVGLVLDLLAGNHRNRRRGILDLLGETRGGNHHVVQLHGLLAFGTGLGGVQRAEGNGEAGSSKKRGHVELSLRNVKVW